MELNQIYNMDCIKGLKQLDTNSVDSIVTDPPYELGFMEKKWDSMGISYNVDLWKECLRVLKPGGHMLIFAAPRTYHRMACAVEDAGFEIRDQIQWLFGSGMPKSQNISKYIDKKLGVKGEKIGENRFGKTSTGQASGWHENKAAAKGKQDVFAPASEEAIKWFGWGTALKPANEPICMARKPLSEKTIVANVLRWGTGGINIDDCRVETDEVITNHSRSSQAAKSKGIYGDSKEQITHQTKSQQKGRFPANVIMDEEAGKILDEQTGTLKSGKNAVRTKTGSFIEHGGLGHAGDVQTTYGDSGGASRFYYCAKASKKERGSYNNHPTVKPIKLMEYLVTLVTPSNGVILDPFSGSGSTLIAAKNKGFNYIGFELDSHYCDIANKRLHK